MLTSAQRRVAAAISDLSHCNPFLPERIELERAILGRAFQPRDAGWSKQAHLSDQHPNLIAIHRQAESIVAATRARFLAGPRGDDAADRTLYEHLVEYRLYHQFRFEIDAIIEESAAATAAAPPRRVACYGRFAELHREALGAASTAESAARFFALCFQVRRAFHHIFNFILGASHPAARLRAQVWQSIFTHDMRRYRRALLDRLGDLTTLVTGPSGTGKELVARAIALSRFIPIDPRTGLFAEQFTQTFFPLNLSALSPTLIESELFGHVRGSFTGAFTDRVGWLELCPPLGTVFLDEIGELDPGLQVKLLRVLQSRAFQRIGEHRQRAFGGKVIAATNRDLAASMREGRFREDLYYRLCSDVIVTPCLREQLDDNPAALDTLLAHVAERLVGAEEAPALAAESAQWIRASMPADYPWPGNVRELEQCARNILVRSAYTPSRPLAADGGSGLAGPLAALAAAGLSADDLLAHYCSLVYARCGSYRETARRLSLDQRTAKARVDPALVARYTQG